ncbi:CocE/NonD family hydrolase, partial [Chloroflexota bacterium]
INLSAIEAGNTEFFVSRGYVHVIADVRGTGYSEGEYVTFSREEQEDGYDLVEWIAGQPWCNGNVGMLGMSYFAIIQYLVAAQQPPHLKAIFPCYAWGDLYRDIAYHGGILSLFWVYLWTGMVATNPISATKSKMDETELQKKIDELKNCVDIQQNPTLYGVLLSPEKNPFLFDLLLTPEDGPFYWERSAYAHYHEIKVPVYLVSGWSSTHMHLPGAFSGYHGINAPKKLLIGGGGFMWPWLYEYHDDALRWYNYWLKGIDNGVMDEPPIKIFVMGTDEWRSEKEWPLARTKWTKFYLKADGLLEEIPPIMDDSPHDGYIHQLPFKETYKLKYATKQLPREMEVTGPIALYLYAALDVDDTNWIVKLRDVHPDGSARVVTKGWLKASHREIDLEISKPWQPFHPHQGPTLIKHGQIYEYAIEVRPTSQLFKAGHRVELEIASYDSPATELAPIYHLPHAQPTTHTIYHTPKHPSHLLLPVIP